MLTKEELFRWLYFFVLALAILSPLASDQYIVNSVDCVNHIIGIAQAKQALDHGQILLRTTPTLHNGWGYPFFQFYSPAVYLLAGTIHKWLTPDNPYIAFKWTLGFFLTLAGVFFYRVAYRFTSSSAVALLAATAYLFSPYLLVDVVSRGDLTESVAICLVPLVLYINILCQEKFSLKIFILTALSWALLITTHIVTFIYSSIFIGIFLIGLNIQERYLLRQLLRCLLAYVMGCALVMYFLAPIIHLQSSMYIHHALGNPYYKGWLNPLSSFFAVQANKTLFSNYADSHKIIFYMSLGWPILIALGITIYKKWLLKEKQPQIVNLLFYLLLFALIIAWSPINFWKFLPVQLGVLQYGFRLLIQVMWLGALLFALCVKDLLPQQFTYKSIAMGIFLIVIANASWLGVGSAYSKTVDEIVKSKNFAEWGANGYLVSPLLTHYAGYPENVLSVMQTKENCHFYRNTLQCVIRLKESKNVQLPIFYYPDLLQMKINNQDASYFYIPLYNKKNETALDMNPMLVSVLLPAGDYDIAVSFRGLIWGNIVSILTLGLIVILSIVSLVQAHRPRYA